MVDMDNVGCDRSRGKVSRVERPKCVALHRASEVSSPGNADIWAWLKFLCVKRKSDIAPGPHVLPGVKIRVIFAMCFATR